MTELNRRDLLKSAAVASMSFSVEDVRASLCRDSFYDFVQQFWSTVVPEKPIWNWHVKYLCDELQYVANRVFANLPKEYDLIINISPGSTKSTICSIMYPAWIWTQMATARIIGGSYAKDLSMELARKNREVVRSEKYQDTFIDVRLKDDQNVKSHFVTTKGGGRLAVGTGGAVTGFHGHFIIVDDPLNPNEALSEVELKNANTWMAETLSNRKVDQAMTPTILIMQRLHQNDPTADMIERAKQAQRNEILMGDKNAKVKIKHICLPAEKAFNIKPKRLRKYYKKGLMDTKRLSRSVLNEKKATMGEYGYAGQMLQHPVPLGGGMFKVHRIEIDEAPKKWKYKIRFWDKAGTTDGGAFTVGALLGLDRDKTIWILDIIRGQLSSSVREKIIKQTAMVDGKTIKIGIEQEPGSGGKESAENTVRNLMGFSVKIDKPSGSKSSKELRADPFSVQVNSNNVRMVKAEWNRALLNELQYFPASKYKDQVDACSGAFNMLMAPRMRAGTW